MAYTGQSLGTQGFGTGQGITAFASQAIKIVYGDLHEQLRDKNPALQFIEASASHITQNGKQVQFDTHIGRNSGIGARGHIEFQFNIVDDGQTSFLVLDPGYIDQLIEYLTKMKFMLRVDVADVSDTYACIHFYPIKLLLFLFLKNFAKNF